VHYGVAEELDLLRRWLAFAARVRPSIPALLGPRVDRLAKDAVECEPHDPVPIHRDFHDKQVIVDGRSATLIDFDTVRAGDAAQDVGNFLAHIQLGAVQAAGGQTGTQAWRAFFDGYGSAALVPSRTNVDWHRRASLLRLALICGFSDSSSHMTETLAEAAGIEHERPDGLRSVQASGCC
jgi:aminoglycoside phosphotransferase (APT) family kinase protein